MKRVLLILFVVMLVISACSDGVIGRTVVEKQQDRIGYRLVVRECRAEGTKLKKCEYVTYSVTKETYDINEVGKEYKKP